MWNIYINTHIDMNSYICKRWLAIICVRYDDDGSKELNAWIQFLLHMVYL